MNIRRSCKKATSSPISMIFGYVVDIDLFHLHDRVKSSD